MSREFCSKVLGPNNTFYYAKDLTTLLVGRQLSDMVLVDNRAASFSAFHLTNGIPIKDYLGDDVRDKELRVLTPYLIEMIDRKEAEDFDVRD